MSRTPRQDQLEALVAQYPGRSTYWYVRQIAPTGVPGGRPGIGYGYETVKRAVRAGRVRYGPGKRRGWTVLLPVTAE